jgi:hypothetical protein
MEEIMHDTFRPTRRAAFLLAMGAVVIAGALAPAQAAGSMSIFKIVTPKDDMFVGLTAEELEKLGTGPTVDLLAKKIAADGQMSLWHYAVKRGADGQMVYGAIGRVSVFAAGVVRIEPYKPVYDVMAPTQ